MSRLVSAFVVPYLDKLFHVEAQAFEERNSLSCNRLHCYNCIMKLSGIMKSIHNKAVTQQSHKHVLIASGKTKRYGTNEYFLSLTAATPV